MCPSPSRPCGHLKTSWHAPSHCKGERERMPQHISLGEQSTSKAKPCITIFCYSASLSGLIWILEGLMQVEGNMVRPLIDRGGYHTLLSGSAAVKSHGLTRQWTIKKLKIQQDNANVSLIRKNKVLMPQGLSWYQYFNGRYQHHDVTILISIPQQKTSQVTHVAWITNII